MVSCIAISIGLIPCVLLLYNFFVRNVTQDTQDAADIVLVDESGSMINEQTWLLVMVPFLEDVLTSAGTCSSAKLITMHAR